MTRCWDANPDVRPPFAEVVAMLEHAETEIMTTVRKARFSFVSLREGSSAPESFYFSQMMLHSVLIALVF
ncbi:hypothetical protein CUMW_028330 [Citrus unshiu]|nr:hypothetical protein CUMW_028330 [Citrus unshiu]